LCLAIIAFMFLLDPANRLSIGVCFVVLLLLIVWSFVKFRSYKNTV